ncbi:MAG: TonB-dependent receptor [Caulobacterales bacterium]
MPIDQPPTVETVVVQTDRLPPPRGDAAFSILTIDPPTLTSRDRLDEALETTPGLSLFRRTSSLGANPTTQGVSLRSFAPSAASRALVTLDGVPLNDPFGGWVIWTAVPAQSLDGAEIVRGAGAGPYGAGALTGTIVLTERGASPGAAVDVSSGGLGERRAAGAGVIGGDAFSLLAVGGLEHSDGWIPVRRGRGAADDALTLDDWNLAARGQAAIGAGVLALRGGAFHETRSAGLVGAGSAASGDFASATYAVQPQAQGLGYRLQAWMRQSNLVNTSVAVGAGRAFTTPANDQYYTPAIGYGFNAAVRGAGAAFDWEAGVDVRADSGDDHELFSFASGAFTKNRDAGGRTMVAGGYLDADATLGRWLVTGGLRADYWASSDAHLIERSIATGAITLNAPGPDRGGVLPTARLGVRRDLTEDIFVRASAYMGFRAATLNELYRPFRVGNNVTEANPLLNPERLEGVEAGVGGADGQGGWSLTAFASRLIDPIINVTIGNGPGTFPIAGFIPAGGILFRRENAGEIDAVGLEGEAHRRFGDALELTAEGNWTSARVDGRAVAPQLTGKRPAQSPALTLTGAAIWRPIAQLSLTARIRYLGSQFDDDLNTLRLNAATTVGLEARWRVTPGADVYVATDNLFNAAVQTQDQNGVFSYDAPCTVRVGISVRR